MPWRFSLSALAIGPLLASASCREEPTDGVDPPAAPPVGCAELASADLGLRGVVVSSSEEVEAGSSDAVTFPRHCVVRG